MIHKIPFEWNHSVLQLYRNVRAIFLNTVLLESMDPPSKHARQSVICFEPESIFRVNDQRIYRNGIQIATGFDNVLSSLRSILAKYNQDMPEIHFTGGLLGFTSYTIVTSIEDIPQRHRKEFPDAMYGLYLDGIVFDHVRGEVFYFHQDSYRNRFRLVQDALKTDVPDAVFTATPPEFSVTASNFMHGVRSIKDKIYNGEIFQAVLSQRANFKISGDRIGIYRKLREINPSPYMYCIEFQDLSIIGSSPELLVEVRDRRIITFPIAGTRPRGATEEERKKFAEDLLADEKELAEHNMLVDLARNDIGKVAKIGSVKLAQYLAVEEFSHVVHLVSEVRAELNPSLDQFDAFFALFPAGTVSGAPKIRAMSFIDELEESNRGPYAGSIGYFGIGGDMVQAIAIRTAFGIGNDFHLQAGAGIVLDSDPESEYEETIRKLGALFQAIAVR